MVLLNAAINALFNLLSASVAFLISYYAFSTNRLVGNNLLKYISAGFLLLGVGIFTESLTQGLVGLTPVDIARFHGLELVGFVIFVVFQVIAYGVFAWGYALSAFGKPRTAVPAAVAMAVLPATALGKTLLELFIFSADIFLVAQLAIILLMVFVVVQGFFVYSRSKNPLALTVLAGFFLIFIAHIVLFSSVVILSEPVYLVGTFVQFLGFLSLLYFLYRSERLGSS